MAQGTSRRIPRGLCVAAASWLLVVGLVPGCAAGVPVLGETEQVVPGALPEQVVPQDANNNLDVIRHEGRIFLAFRTSPTHFASDETQMYVVSSDDGRDWTYEWKIAKGTDVREPNFLSVDGALYLFYAVLGDNPLAFSPQGTERIVRRAAGDWSEPASVFDATFIPWRMKELEGRHTLVGYTGGANIYSPGGEPLEVLWLGSEDGLDWQPWVPGQPVVQVGGGSETDLVIRKDGVLVAVTRNEAGDETGFGSKICRAEPDALGDWTCASDPRKYDSPLLFQAEGRIWLVGRRNVTDDGHYDLMQEGLTLQEEAYTYQGAYWREPKRCSLWQVDGDALTVTWVLDLPSKGDTCFPELLEEDGVFTLYNYSSDPDGPDWDWLEGQTRPTNIYRTNLTFE